MNGSGQREGECWIEGCAAGWGGGEEGDGGGVFGTSNIITLFSVWFA